jgi:chemotaxis protein methyltransferase CheR
MDEFGSTDTLSHVRFVGRPTIAMSRSPRQGKPPLPAAKPVVAHPSEPPGQFISWAFERAGLAVESYRGEPLRRRLSACLRALHAHTEAQARRILEQRPDLLPAAISALLIGVTEFFRDFETLRTEVVPELALRSRPLRVLSAGCSNGAELYSVAILLAQAGLLEDSFLLGSDCRQDAIEQAQAALYNSNDLRKIDPSDHRRYFEKAGNLWRPIEPLRRHVHWEVADLGRRIEEGPWDIILWRNMAIYLEAEAAASVWRDLASVLAPDGILVVGKAEQPPVELSLIYVRRCIYRACSRASGRASWSRRDRQTIRVQESRKHPYET